MLREVTSRGGGGRGGLLGGFKGSLVGAVLLKPFEINSKIEYFLEENLYYAERHKPSELNMEVTPLPPPPKKALRGCLSVNSQGNHFPYMEAKKRCIC